MPFHFLLDHRITYNILTGAYVPLTMEGQIMVDECLASCYAFYDHDLPHMGIAPIRWIPQIMEWIFGKESGNLSLHGSYRGCGQMGTLA